MDDMGYTDLGCYGSGISTPNIDALAADGIKFTDFYAAANVCSPSRASLITGLYQVNNGIDRVLFPKDAGLSHQHKTIAQYLKPLGYTSGIVGKWHLGATPQYLPLQYGFSFYYGLPYSNDMLPNKSNPDLPVYLNDKVAEVNPDQSLLTTNYAEQSVKFINENSTKPFFLYLAHSMPHIPLAVSDKFKGKSGKGLYADVIMEIDWSVGELVNALKKNGLYHNTIIMITSDNGPWLSFGNHAGSSKPLREGKFTTFEGGHREPFIIYGLGKKKPVTTPASMVDIFPTIAALAKGKKPLTDGISLLPLIKQGKTRRYNNRVIPFYVNSKLQAIRWGKYKYHVQHQYLGLKQAANDGKSGSMQQLTVNEALFDILDDQSENIAVEEPEILKKMRVMFEEVNAKGTKSQ